MFPKSNFQSSKYASLYRLNSKLTVKLTILLEAKDVFTHSSLLATCHAFVAAHIFLDWEFKFQPPLTDDM